MVSEDLLADPLEELEFLARSPNRINVLDTLTGGTMGRYELEDAAGVTRATLGRILDDFEVRGWVIEEDREYATTALGEYVAREFVTLLEHFEPVPALNEVAQWFPEAGFDFDLEHLRGARIVRSTRTKPQAPTTLITKRIREAARVRLLTYAVLPGVMETCWRGAVEGDLEFESIVSSSAYEDFATDPHLLERAAELVQADNAEVVFYVGDIPSTVFLVDDAVLLCLSGGEGAPLAVIETTDEVVRTWAEESLERYRREGEQVDPSLFTA